MPFVLDASVALAWHFTDERSQFSERVLERLQDDRALVPALWPLEIANALISAERRGRLSAAGVARAAALTLALPVHVEDAQPGTALQVVLEVARSYGLSAYDAAYLELAMREGLPLATQDNGLLDACRRAGVALLN